MAKTKPISLAEAIALGNESLGKKDYTSAANAYSYAITLTPEFPGWETAYLCYFRGKCYEKQGIAYQEKGAYHKAATAYNHASSDYSYVAKMSTRTRENEYPERNFYYLEVKGMSKRLTTKNPEFLNKITTLSASIKDCYDKKSIVLDIIHTAWLENKSYNLTGGNTYHHDVETFKKIAQQHQESLEIKKGDDGEFASVQFINPPTKAPKKIENLQETIYNDLLQQPKFRNNPEKLVKLNNMIKQFLPHTNWLQETLPERASWRDYLCSSSSAKIAPQSGFSR